MSEAQANGQVWDRRARIPIPPTRALPSTLTSSPVHSSLLALDPDLAEGLLPDMQRLLREQVRAQVEVFPTGGFSLQHERNGICALLLVDGLLAREVQVAGRTSAELFGPGDVVHLPGAEGDPSASPAAQWTAIMPGHLALLDSRLLAHITQASPLLFALAGRETRRRRTLGALALTRAMRRTDERLLFLLSFLAARWGRIRPDGIRLSLPASHELLAKLIGTRRQAVTTALSDLRSRGLITTLPDGDWLLSNHPSLSKPPHSTATQTATSRGVGAGQVNLLYADSGLASVLSAAQLAEAQKHARVRTRMLAVGSWDPIASDGSSSTWLGLLVLDGFLSLETSYGSESALEIVGPGDLLRPWDDDLAYPLPDIRNNWRVLTPTTLALLDGEFAAAVAPWTALTTEILARAARRARWLTARLAISQQIHVRDRILYLFARLASRWGNADRFRPIVPVPLTHEQIAKLIGAQRPSVTIAVGKLRQQGLLMRLPDRTWRMDNHDTSHERREAQLNHTGGG